MPDPFMKTRNCEQSGKFRGELIHIYNNSQSNKEFYDNISHISNEELFIFIDNKTLKTLKSAGSYLIKELNEYHIELISDDNYLKLPHFMDVEAELYLNQYYNLGVSRNLTKLSEITQRPESSLKVYFYQCRFEKRISQKLLKYQEMVNKKREDAVLKAGELLSEQMSDLLMVAIHGALTGGLEPTQQRMLTELIKMGGVASIEQMKVTHEGFSQNDMLAMLGINNKSADTQEEKGYLLVDTDDEDIEPEGMMFEELFEEDSDES